MSQAGRILSVLGLGALVGGMLFFGIIMAPLVFTKLPPEVIGPFIRASFPRYYAFIVCTALLGALGFAMRRQLLPVLVLLVLAAVTLWLWFWLIPLLNALRAAGNMAGFARGHRFSVWVNGAQLLSALWLLARTAL